MTLDPASLLICRTLPALRAALRNDNLSAARIGFVPTMGALHDGHLALVRAAQTVTDRVVVSIFVNPTQFGPNEDFAAYPRVEEDDLAQLRSIGTNIVYIPDSAIMYPDGYNTIITVPALSDLLCGAARPGHFSGVATVVAKLFNQVQPTHAFFGEKDYQQLQIIKRLTRDLDFPVTIVGVPISRATDGLALSSRNAYLNPEQRHIAPAFYRVLCKSAAKIIVASERATDILHAAETELLQQGFAAIDYIRLVDAESLEEVDTSTRPARLIAAAWLGKTRLIDNIAVLN